MMSNSLDKLYHTALIFVLMGKQLAIEVTLHKDIEMKPSKSFL